MAKKKILVVDNEQLICELLKQCLETIGSFDVFTCSVSTQAISQVKTIRPDLVILDEQMPVMSGSDIAEKLKSDHSTENIPVVFLTGIITDQEIHQRGNMIGGHYFLSKPLKMDELADVVKELLGV